MSTIASPKFYVYVLIRPHKGLPQGKVFYVGKGQGRRVFKHDAEARSGHVCPKCRTIRKVWRQGGQVQRYIIFTTDNEQEAFTYEMETIALYGRKNLCNLTDGGEGISGFKRSPEACAKMSENAKKRWADASPEQRAKWNANRFQPHGPEVSAKMSASSRGRRVTEATKEKLRISAKRLMTPEKAAKMRAGAATPESRRKQSAAAKGRKASDETKTRQSVARRIVVARHKATRPIPICSIEGCGRIVDAKGLCSMHYKRSRKIRVLRPEKPKFCTSVGCETRTHAKGLCKRHYKQARKAAKEQDG